MTLQNAPIAKALLEHYVVLNLVADHPPDAHRREGE